MITEKQAQDRAKGIGSSDAPAICGVYPWRTAWEVWAEKTGRLPAFEGNDATFIGSTLEQGLRTAAAEIIGEKIVAPKGTLVAKNGIMRANLDGMVGRWKRGQPLVECKVTSLADKWGKSGTNEVPDYVLAQVHHQMVCAGSYEAHIIALVAGFRLEYRHYIIERDEDVAAYVERACVRFWTEHVEPDVAPEITEASDDMLGVLGRIERDAGATVPVAAELVETFLATKTAEKLAADAHKTARARLLNALGDASVGESDAGTVKVVQVKQSRFDSKAFRAEHPELEQQYRMTTGFVRLSVKEPKK